MRKQIIKWWKSLTEDEPVASLRQKEVEYLKEYAKRYKEIALLKNQECVGKGRLIEKLYQRIHQLEEVNRCQAEMLAERPRPWCG